MTEHDTSHEEYIEIAEKVRSGEYFREARSLYDLYIHDLMAERYLYILITAASLFIFIIALMGAEGLYPLRTDVPFIVSSNDIVDDLPRIKSLMNHKGELPSNAMLDFLVSNYVVLHESYDIDHFDRNISGVQSQSSSEIFANFQKSIDVQNPESPVVVYQRHSKRIIHVISSRQTSDDKPGMEVRFDATVDGPTGSSTTHWQANLTFQYSGIELDKKTDKVKPFNFIVTGYETKRL